MGDKNKKDDRLKDTVERFLKEFLDSRLQAMVETMVENVLKERLPIHSCDAKKTEEDAREIERLNQELEKAKTKLSEYDKLTDKLKQLESDLQTANTAKTDAQNNCEELKTSLNAEKSKAEAYEKKYGELERCYEKYVSLGEELCGDLKGFFGSSSPLDFYAGAASKSNLTEFWDYVCGGLNNGRFTLEQEEILAFMFDFSLNAVNQRQEEKYEKIFANTGAEFDADIMDKHLRSQQIGTVQKVYLPGFKGDGVIRKCLVELR